LKLLLATRNPGKIKELVQKLDPLGVKCLGMNDVEDPIPEVVEDGKTYHENALKKAMAFQRQYSLPVLADDSGLEVQALGGAPGIHSARYGGVALSWPERWAYLTSELSQFSRPWKAQFRCVLCFIEESNDPIYFEGTCLGEICPEPQGSKGFGYDPIFLSDDLGTSFGLASAEQKQKVSHRTRALSKFIQLLGTKQV